MTGSYYLAHREEILEKVKKYHASHKEQIAAKNREWMAKNPEKVRAYKKRYYSQNKAAILERRKLHLQQHPEKRREYVLRSLYGLEPEAFERLWDKQGGICGICPRPLTRDRNTHVDHDHACCPGYKSCGRCVRGLLCRRCNQGLWFYENVELSRGAARYLASFRERRAA